MPRISCLVPAASCSAPARWVPPGSAFSNAKREGCCWPWPWPARRQTRSSGLAATTALAPSACTLLCDNLPPVSAACLSLLNLSLSIGFAEAAGRKVTPCWPALQPEAVCDCIPTTNEGSEAQSTISGSSTSLADLITLARSQAIPVMAAPPPLALLGGELGHRAARLALHSLGPPVQQLGGAVFAGSTCPALLERLQPEECSTSYSSDQPCRPALFHK
jgi:hypothetical protein